MLLLLGERQVTNSNLTTFRYFSLFSIFVYFLFDSTKLIAQSRAIAPTIVETREIACFFQSSSSGSGLAARYARVKFLHQRTLKSEPRPGMDLNNPQAWEVVSEEIVVTYTDASDSVMFSTQGYVDRRGQLSPVIDSRFIGFESGANQVGVTFSKQLSAPSRPIPSDVDLTMGEGFNSAVYEALIDIEGFVNVYRCDYSFKKKNLDIIYVR